MATENLSELQQKLEPKDYMRSFGQIIAMFKFAGLDFDHELIDEFFRESPYNDFNILDGGCGAGIAIEQATRACLHLLALNPEMDKVNGLGVDLNPIPGQIPSEYLVKGDLSALPIANDSIDFGYSVAALQYVQDALRAFEEAYRVLREGRSMHFLLSAGSDVSFYPDFYTILDNTPGANDVFRWRFGEDDDHSIVTCTKRSDSGFKGFPYEVLFTLPSIFRRPGIRKHIRRTIYAHRDGIVERIKKVFRKY